ncbi:MAG: hypothetical protein Q7U97_14040 [Rhodocyclaceae bacterium]|nr:hypothetical protein [Rhodocyclaceae bacterium]
MPNAVIEDRDKFKAFLAAQPLLQWSAQRQQEIAGGMHGARGQSPVQPPPKNDNTDLAAALAMMA